MMRVLVVLLLCVAAATSAWPQAPTPNGASNGVSSDAPTGVPADLERLAETARAAGSTVVVISPARPPTAPDTMASQMRAERFLAARARLEEIVASAATLPRAAALTLLRIEALAERRGQPVPWFWLLRALATAALGGFAGWLVLRPVVRASGRLARERRIDIPDGTTTAADRARALIAKTLFAVAFAVAIYVVALLVAVVLDSGFEPTRRLVFEALTAFFVYRLLRFGLAWPLTAYDDPTNRIVALDDAQAARVYRSLSLWAAAALVPLAGLRFLLYEGRPAAIGGGPYGALTPEHAALVGGIAVLVATGAVVGFVVANWRAVQCLFVPHGAERRDAGLASRLRGATRLLPVLLLLYTAFALAAFLFRLGLDQPAPAAAIAAPFAIGYVALVVYGLVLVAIQLFYGAREARFNARAEAERRQRLADRAADRARLADGEEMTLPEPDEPDVPPVYEPLLRRFLERGALAIVVTVALGEIGRWWGVPVGEDGNVWAAFLDIVLAVALAWIAYRAITVAIDRRIAEEAGPEPDEDTLGNEGGAGASRLATLLPILRWVLLAVVLVAAVIAVLSRFGVDIGPLLASAGVVGIAIGFGAQKLIQDVFSGAFFLLDDAFRRGEYIEVEGTKGTVERISIRSFQLRHHLGALHTLPFGEIRQLTNYSRDWVLMKLPLRVTYDTDVERVRKLIKRLGQELLEHPEIGHTFLQPLKSQGVYRMEDSAMIIRVKFMTRPGEQFVTRKVVYAAIRDLFERENIRFAHKEVTVRLADRAVDELSPAEREAVSAAAREVVDAEAEAALEPAR